MKKRAMAGVLAAILLVTAGTYSSKAVAEEIEKGRWARTESIMPRSASGRVSQGEIHDIFPQSYWGYLDALKAAHPNWKFEALHTGLDWSYVINEEMYPNTNLVSSEYYPSSWLDLEKFDYKANNWIVGSAPDWVQANRQIVEAYMDPRNFLNEENIFQFEKLTFDGETQTEAGVQAIVRGTFMETNLLENGMTYPQAFMQIAREVNVSPYHLASRIRQEQGAGNSPLISGTVPGYEGYYNYFNIEAYGVTMDEIIHNGMEEAKRSGWSSRYLALQGGSQKVASNYITKGQDTLYLQKFDVDPQYNGMFWHQYMQNLSAAESESLSMRKAYVNMGLVNSSFTFKIPVYENMPGTPTQKPTGTGNPNDRLKSINVNGTELIHFNTDNLTNTDYSIDVACNTAAVTINAEPVASTTTVNYNRNTAIANGSETKIPIKTQAQNGTVRDYTVSVNAAHHFTDWSDVSGVPTRTCTICGEKQTNQTNRPGPGGSGQGNVTIVKDIQISNVTSEGYRITVTLGNTGVVTEIKFPTWTERNGQDDLVWYTQKVSSDTVVYDIKTKNHNNESGKYYTHVYVYNGTQELGVYGQEIIVPAASNSAMIQTVNFSNITSEGYRVTVQLKNASSAQKIQLPTWSEKNGQDDIIWYDGKINGNTAVLDIKTSNHKGDSGKYYTHVYLTDKSGTVTTYYGEVTVPGKSVAAPIISSSVHVQNKGWQSWVTDGKIGTTGSSLRLEGLKIKLDGGMAGNVEYTTHVQDIGWQSWVSNGAMAGTTGKSLRIEAVKIRLSGEIANKYNIQYRAHSQNVGWMDWVSNGAMAGTSGKGLRLEALQIRLVEK